MKLTKRKDGRWQYGYVPEKGKKPKYFYSKEETEKKAEKDIINQIAEYEKKEYKNKHNFKILADKMLQEKEDTVEYNTHQTYIHSIKHLSSFFDMNIEDIRPSMVQNLLNKMAKQKYSFSAISKVKVTFGLIIDFSIINEDLQIGNFTNSLKIPKNVKKPAVHSPDDIVIKEIVKNAAKEPFGMWAMMFLCLGLRRGEQCALQKKNVDFVNDEVQIKNVVIFIGNNPHIKEAPKTETSIGTVPILKLLKPYLVEMCKDLKDDDYLFSKDGKPLTHSAIRRRWEKYCKNIGYTFTGHQLRHAYAKLLYISGTDVKTAQGLLRHKDIQTTLNIYTDFDKEMQVKSVKKLDKHITKKFVK